MAQGRQGKTIKLDEAEFKAVVKKILTRGAILLAIFVLTTYFLDPSMLNGFFFGFLVNGLPFFILGILFLLFGYQGMIAFAREKAQRGLFFFVLAGAIFIFGSIFFSKVENYYTYKKLASDIEKVDSYVPVNKDILRFTPRVVSYNQMESTVRARTETVEWSHTRPYLSEDGFGFVAPVTPDGLRPMFFKKNPGFVKYDDGFNADPVIKKIDQPFEVGEEMQYTDNIFRKLYFHDFFAQYPRIHYVTFKESGEEKFYAVAPKIKYKYCFPFFFIKYWSGTALIDQDGNIEDYSREEIASDPRFEGKWMAPLKLFRDYVEVQDYAVGFWNTFTSVDGMLSVPNLKNNTYPLVIFTKENKTYLVIDTEPQGTGRGLFRVYYQDAQTGEMFYYEPPSNEPIIGPRGAMSKVYSLKGYHWYTTKGEGSSGNMVVLEPVYLTKEINSKQVLFWKFSITSIDRTRVSATVVVEATEGGEVLEFTERADFEKWLHSDGINEVSPSMIPTNSDSTSVNTGVPAERLEKVELLLQQALQELEALKQEQKDTLQ